MTACALMMRRLSFCLLAICLMAYMNVAQAATGNASLSGSTWTGEVDGTTVYTGTSMFDCVNACINNVGSGTVHVWNSGNSGPGIGNIYAIQIRSNVSLDFHGNTINCNGDAYIVPVLGIRANNISITNLNITGGPRYGIWLQTCNDIYIDNIDLNVTGGLGIRVDDSKNEGSSNLVIGEVTATGTSTHAVETYSVNNISIDKVTATDVGGCGVLLNNSYNAWVGEVYGTRCNENGGYAAFRVANNNGLTVCDYVYARDCGRGFFSVSGSKDCTVKEIDSAGANNTGIAIQDAENTHVLSGVVTDGYAIWGTDVNNTITLENHVEGIKSFLNRRSWRALEVGGLDNSNGANIQIYDFWSGENQEFTVSRVGGGLYAIRSVMSGSRSLDIAALATGNGGNVQLYDYWAGDNQKFYLENLDNGYFRLTPSHDTSVCLDAYGTANVSNVGTWTFHGGANQQWEIINP